MNREDPQYNEEHSSFEQFKSQDQLAEEKPEWLPDGKAIACSGCQEPFTFLKRRHHCRGCGKVFCNNCCKKFILLPASFGYKDPERNCETCYRKYSSIDFSRYYDSSGPQDASSIIVIHGTLCNRMFHLYQQRSWSHFYRVIAVDLPAHGSRADEKLTMETAVQSVVDIIQNQIPSRKALIFGYSLGAYVAVHLAKSHSELVAGLVLGGCCGETTNWQSKVYFNAVNAFSMLPNNLIWTLLPSAYSDVSREALEETIFRSGIDFENSSQCTEIMLQVKTESMAEAITHFSGPILFINGEKDDRKLESKFLDAAPSNGRLHIVKGATTLLPIQSNHRDELNEVVLSFAQEIKWN